MELAFVFLDRHIVDARLPPPHQPVFVKLPEFIPISPEPLTVGIVVLVLESDGDPVVCETPQ